MPTVHFRFAHGDFPQYQQGDLEEHPSEALLQAAQTSNCLEILPDDEPATNPTAAARSASQAPAAGAPNPEQ